MNILSLFLFVFLLVTLFIVLTLASKPSRHQRTVQKRLGQLGLGEVVEEEDRKSEALLKQPADLGFPSFDRLLSRLHLYLPLKLLIEQADSQSSPGKVLLTSVATAGAGFVVCAMFVPVLPVRILTAIVAGASPILFLRFKRARRLKAFSDALPDSIDLMARALRAGHSVASAIEVVAEQGNEPVASEFALVYQQQNFGLPFRDALMTMAQRIQSKDLQFVVTAMLVQKETGGNLAEILDRTTFVIRERMRIFGEVRTKSAQGRLTGWILTLMPVVMGFAINLINHGFERPLFTEHIGHIMLYAGAGMLATGSFIISRIVDIEV